jgi:hypothetical protein
LSAIMYRDVQGSLRELGCKEEMCQILAYKAFITDLIPPTRKARLVLCMAHLVVATGT